VEPGLVVRNGLSPQRQQDLKWSMDSRYSVAYASGIEATAVTSIDAILQLAVRHISKRCANHALPSWHGRLPIPSGTSQTRTVGRSLLVDRRELCTGDVVNDKCP
jgi:hypothetical protein